MAAAAAVAALLLTCAALLWLDGQDPTPEAVVQPPGALDESRVKGPGARGALEAQGLAPAPAPTLVLPSLPTSESTAPADGPTCQLTLRVVDAHGAPLAAWVTHSPGDVADPPRASSATTADGDWRALIPIPEPNRSWRVLAEAPGHVSSWLQVPFLPEGRLDLGTLRLDRVLRVEGRVLDARGLPLAGARVQSRGVLRSVSHRAVRALSDVALSDDQGRFALDLAETPANYDLKVLAWHAEAGGPFEEPLGDPADGTLDPITVRFGASSSVRGVVVRRDGSPLPGVTVSPSVSPRFALADVLTDASGRFEFPLAAGHTVQLGYHGEGLVPLDIAPMSVAAPARDVRLLMVSASTLRLDVRDALDGRPVPEPRLTFCSDTWGYGRCHKASGVDGWIEKDALPPGSWRSLVVSAPGYQSQEVPAQVVSEGQLVGPLLVRLMPQTVDAVVRGRVVDERGQPVAGADVSALLGHVSGPDATASATSDLDGSFLVGPLPSGELTLLARDDLERQAEPLTGALTSAGWTDVRLVLEHPPAIDGRVWLSKERPASGALLQLSPDGTPGPATPATASAVADEQGRFRITSRPGRYRLWAWQRLPGQPVTLKSPTLLVELAPREQRWLDVPLTLPTLTVDGRLLADESTTGWSVSWRYAADLIEADWRAVLVQAHESGVGPAGDYLLEGVRPGVYKVTIRRADESLVATQQVRVDTSLDPTVTLDLHVSSGDG